MQILFNTIVLSAWLISCVAFGSSVENVCTRTLIRVEPVAEVESVTTRSVEYVPFGECGCETKTLYRTVITNHTTYVDQVVYYDEEVCCMGWQGTNCDIPVCDPSCDFGRTCIAPNTCSCPPGYEGSDCSDIDECEESNGGCEQTCVNTEGSYHCQCDQGYKLRSDGKTCEFMCGVPQSKCFGCKRYEVHTSSEAEVDWNTARQNCEAAGALLAMPKTSDIHVQIREYILSNNLDIEVDKGFWVGLHDNNVEGEYTWVDDSLLTDTGFTKWSSGNPNNNTKKDEVNGQDCVQLWKVSHLDWDDDYCFKTKGFICEFDIC